MTNRIDLPLRQVFNERSLRGCVGTNGFGDRMLAFAALVRALQDAGFSFGLAISRRLSARETIEGEKLHEWLFRTFDGVENRERKNVLRTLFTRGLLLEEMLSPIGLDEEVLLEDEPLSGADWVSGLAASYYLGVPSVSVQAETGHEDGVYRLQIRFLDRDDVHGGIRVKTQDVLSISRIDQIRPSLEAIRLASIRQLEKCEDIRGTLLKMFPRLEFSVHALKQVESRSFSDMHEAFFWYCKMLYEIDFAWTRVREGAARDFFSAFGPVAYMAPSESGVTRASFRDEHTFTGLDGTRHVCFSHCKNKFLNLRIYFDVPSDPAAPIFIGHIGGHCDTVKFH